MNIHFIKTPEKRRITEILKEQFGITHLPYLLIESGKEKIRAFSGHLSKEEIMKITSLANIELIGAYLIKKEHDLRLSLDATNILHNQITKNIIEINNEEFHEWIRGRDLEKQIANGSYIIKFKDDFLGCARSNGSKLFNFIPKDRRLKKWNNYITYKASKNNMLSFTLFILYGIDNNFP